MEATDSDMWSNGDAHAFDQACSRLVACKQFGWCMLYTEQQSGLLNQRYPDPDIKQRMRNQGLSEDVCKYCGPGAGQSTDSWSLTAQSQLFGVFLFSFAAASAATAAAAAAEAGKTEGSHDSCHSPRVPGTGFIETKRGRSVVFRVNTRPQKGSLPACPHPETACAVL